LTLAGTRVLLTGGGSGLGRHMAQRLAEDGAELAVIDRDAEACAALRAALGDSVQTFVADLSEAAQVDAVVQQVQASGFAPGVLVNNAGVIHSEPLVNLLARGADRVHSREQWRRVMAIDLDSVFYLTGRIVDGWLATRTKGVVVSVSSIAARGNAGQSAYAAAKAGVEALTRSWAKELGPMGLRFVALAPGFIDTASTRAALSPAALQRLQQAVPLRRLGTPEAVYLALRQAIENDYMTGTVLEIDGGLVL